jgi:FAD/FMN-containing dehydrogenase
VPAADTAFSARRALWDVDVLGQWDNPAESDPHIPWVRTTWDKMAPFLGDHAYVNHISGDEPPEKIRASYGTNHGRLRQLKARYDPTNLFRLNPNIPPA